MSPLARAAQLEKWLVTQLRSIANFNAAGRAIVFRDRVVIYIMLFISAPLNMLLFPGRLIDDNK